LNIPYGLEGQYASARKISSKSVEQLLKYSNLSIFVQDGGCHVGFVGQILGRPTTRM